MSRQARSRACPGPPVASVGDPDAPRPQRRRVRAGRLHRAAPARPRGARGRPQAARHVHRVDRQPRPACTASGRSSTTRSTRPSAATATTSRSILHADGSVEVRDNGRGIPVDVEPQDRAVRRRGRHDQAARRRQVRRRLLRRLRRPARRRRLRGQRPRPRGWTSRSTATATPTSMSFRRGVPGTFARRRPDAPFAEGVGRARQVGKVAEEAHRHPRALLGRPPDLPQGRRRSPWTSCTTRARQTAFLVPGPDHRRARRARPPSAVERDLPLRRRHQRVLRVPGPGQAGQRRRCGCTGSGTSRRPSRSSTTRAT